MNAVQNAMTHSVLHSKWLKCTADVLWLVGSFGGCGESGAWFKGDKKSTVCIDEHRKYIRNGIWNWNQMYACGNICVQMKSLIQDYQKCQSLASVLHILVCKKGIFNRIKRKNKLRLDCLKLWCVSWIGWEMRFLREYLQKGSHDSGGRGQNEEKEN